jgi:putative ABC transport system substrate-binding protein
MMQRREFITLLGGAAAAWPPAAHAQQTAVPVIGHLSNSPPDVFPERLEAFRKGLSDAGYVEGKNVTIVYRFTDGQYDRLPALAAELVRSQVAIIYAAGIPAARAAKAATATIPIVFSFGEDPVKEGIVSSLNRPGGNITGFSWLSNQLIGKRLALLSEFAPRAAVIAFLAETNNNPTSGPDVKEAQIAAGALGRQLDVLPVSNRGDFEKAFSTMAQRQIGALTIGAGAIFLDWREQIAASYRIPAIYDQRLYAAIGGLMSMARATRMPAVRLASMSGGFSGARDRVTCRSSNRPRLILSSISRLQRRSGSISRPWSSLSPTR